MAIANYADLQASVAAFLRRSDMGSVIPDLIALGEVRINGDLDARLQDVRTTIDCVAGQNYVALPSDTINVRSLSVATNPLTVLDYLTPDQFDTQYGFAQTGLPQAYTVIGTSAYLAPTPDSAYTLNIVYKGRVPAISSGTNWLITTYPNVYLYAALCEAAPYIKDDARMAIWETKYREAIDTVNAQDWFSGSTMRVRTDVRA